MMSAVQGFVGWRMAAPGVVLRSMVVALCLLASGTVAKAEARAEKLGALMQALRISDTVQIMRDEGLAYADQVAATMLPQADGRLWREHVEGLYDTGRMQSLVEQEITRSLDGVDLAPILAFYQSDAGRRSVAEELAARRAFLDPDVEAAARRAARAAAAAQEGPRAELFDRVMRLIDSGDLIGRNVAASLNADMMFWRGVMAAGGPGPAGEGEDLADVVTADLEAMRADTEAWMTAFLLTACGQMTDRQMQDYIAFYETSAGRKLNSALFDGFNEMYDQLAFLLGHAVGVRMSSVPL